MERTDPILVPVAAEKYGWFVAGVTDALPGTRRIPVDAGV